MSTRLALFILAFSCAVCLADATAFADKNYWVDRVDVDAAVQPDGTVQVTEEMSYRFSGRYRYAYRDIPLDRGVDVSGVRVSERGSPYAESAAESAGTFHVERSLNQVRITWYYSARNEARTFTVEYVVSGAVHRHQDVAEFYYQVIGSGWEKRIAEASMRVELPRGVEMSNIRAWAHGPLYGRVDVAGEGLVTLRVAPLPAHTFFEGRILFPSQFVPGMDYSGRGERLAAITAQENKWAAESDRQREAYEERVARWREERARKDQLARRLLPVAVALGLFAVGMWFVMFRRVGWPHTVMSRTARGEIPSEHPPALVSYLMARSVGGRAIVATLLDLAERGYFEVRETVEERRGFFGRKEVKNYHFDRSSKSLSGLAPFELDLIEFMMSEAGDGSSFNMLGLKKAARKHRRTFQKWYQSWSKSVGKAAKDARFFEPWDVGRTLTNVFVGVGVAGAGVVFSIVTQSPAGLPAIIGGVLAAVLSVTLNRRSEDGQRLMLAWKGFRAHLKSISRAMGPTTLDSHEWSRYLAIAIIFGMHKKLLPSMQMVDSGNASGFPIWYYGIAGNSNIDSVASMADGMTAMVNSVTATVSSSTGAGGAASGGGGGGAGGGGGGAG